MDRPKIKTPIASKYFYRPLYNINFYRAERKLLIAYAQIRKVAKEFPYKCNFVKPLEPIHELVSRERILLT